MNRWGLLATCALLLAFSAGCTSSSNPAPSPTPPSSPVGVWGTMEPPAAGVDIKEDGTFLADNQCSIEGNWTYENGKVTFEKKLIVQVRCETEGFDELTYGTIVNNTLTLYRPDDTEIMRLERAGGK